MDEPFGAVDPITRRELRAELRRIHAETGKTILLVTHDPEEALELGTQVVLLRAGRIVMEGPPDAVVGPRADGFARHLLGGAQPGLRRLSVLPAAAALEPVAAPGAPVLPASASLADALSLMAEHGVDRVALAGAEGSIGATAALRG
jgi:osmoprotectant transport system ATP-binding protein